MLASEPPVPDFNFTLWHDHGILFERHRKTAASLIATQRVLQKRLCDEPHVAEFVALVDHMRRLPSTAFTRVWAEPAAYYWARIAYQLLGAVLDPAVPAEALAAYRRDMGDLDAQAALVSHLQRFKELVLGASVISGEPLRLTTPIRASLPYPIFGTEYYLAGVGDVDLEILGYRDGALDLAIEGVEMRLVIAGREGSGHAVTLQRCPVVQTGDSRLYLQPYTLQWPGVDFVGPAVAAGLEFQRGREELLTAALELMRRYAPDVHGQFGAFMYGIVFKPLGAGTYSNMSHSDFPGTAIVGLYHNPYALAENLIHEFHHNRLFGVEEMGPFFVQPAGGREEIYYSPWRDEPRPLHGLLHAVYVFVPVSEFWLRVIDDKAMDDAAILGYARDRLLRGALQLRLGISQLRDHSQFTALGDRILESLGGRIDSLFREIRSRGLDWESPAVICREIGDFVREQDDAGAELTVLGSVRRHAQLHDIWGQCRHLLDGPGQAPASETA